MGTSKNSSSWYLSIISGKDMIELRCIVAIHKKLHKIKCCIFLPFAFLCWCIASKKASSNNSMRYFNIFSTPKGTDCGFSQLKAVKLELFSMQISMQSKKMGNHFKMKS